MADVAQMKKALSKRKKYMMDNLQTLNMKALRRLLEQDMGLEAKSLDGLKSEFAAEVDKILAAKSDPEPSPAAAKAEEKTASKASKPAKASAGGAPQHSAAVAKMKGICNRAGIRFGPNIYRKPNVKAAFVELLEKHGLTKDSSADEIARVKQRLDKERDLEGIDLSNVVEGGRRRRSAVSYAKKAYTESSEEEEESEEDEKPVKRSKAKRRPVAPNRDDSDDFGESEEAGGDSDDGDSDQGEKTAKRKRDSQNMDRQGHDNSDGADSDDEGDLPVVKRPSKRQVALSDSEDRDSDAPIAQKQRPAPALETAKQASKDNGSDDGEDSAVSSEEDDGEDEASDEDEDDSDDDFDADSD